MFEGVAGIAEEGANGGCDGVRWGSGRWITGCVRVWCGVLLRLGCWVWVLSGVLLGVWVVGGWG